MTLGLEVGGRTSVTRTIFVVGKEVTFFVGDTVFFMVGLAVGDFVGIADGDFVGVFVGVTDGDTVGEVVGLFVGVEVTGLSMAPRFVTRVFIARKFRLPKPVAGSQPGVA